MTDTATTISDPSTGEAHQFDVLPPVAPASPPVASPPSPVEIREMQKLRTERSISQRKHRMDGLKAWEPSVSHPCRPRDITLKSVFSQRLLGMNFYRAQIAVYTISVIMPIMASQADASAVEDILNDKLGKIRSDLDVEIGRLRKVCEDNAIDTEGMRYTDAIDEQVPIYTPEANAFLNLLLQFDVLAQLADILWMSTQWRQDQRNRCIHEWRSRLVNFAREINTLQIRGRMAIRRRDSEKLATMVAKEQARLTRRTSDGDSIDTQDNDSNTGSDGSALAMEVGQPPSMDVGGDSELISATVPGLRSSSVSEIGSLNGVVNRVKKAAKAVKKAVAVAG